MLNYLWKYDILMKMYPIYNEKNIIFSPYIQKYKIEKQNVWFKLVEKKTALQCKETYFLRNLLM